jgi:hypothetical protein
MDVVKWVSYTEADKLPIAFGGLGGFFREGMRWGEYLGAWEESAYPYIEALRADIIKRGIKECGPWHQKDPEGAPVFSDGTSATFSYRAWGDLLAAIWSTEEDRDSHYMEFY